MILFSLAEYCGSDAAKAIQIILPPELVSGCKIHYAEKGIFLFARRLLRQKFLSKRSSPAKE